MWEIWPKIRLQLLVIDAWSLSHTVAEGDRCSVTTAPGPGSAPSATGSVETDKHTALPLSAPHLLNQKLPQSSVLHNPYTQSCTLSPQVQIRRHTYSAAHTHTHRKAQTSFKPNAHQSFHSLTAT